MTLAQGKGLMFPRFPRWGCALGLTLAPVLLCVGSVSALGEPSGFELRFSAPPECPSAGDVTAAIDALVTSKPAEPLKVDAKIERDGERWTVKVEWGSGQRSVQGDSCEGVTRALIAIVALAVDPSAQVQEGAAIDGVAEPLSPLPGPSAQALSETRVEPPRTPSPREAVAASQPESAGQQGRAQRIQFGASLLAQGEWGALPAPSYGPTILARGSLGPWRVELGGSWLFRQWVQIEGAAPGKGGYISWRALQANGCHDLGRLAAACAGIEVGELRGESRGLTVNDEGTSLWLAGSLSALGRLPVGRGFAAEGRIVLAFPVFPPEFSVAPYGTLHQPNWISGRLAFGIGFR